ncbi:MAG: DegT/DnrJ/EryC1/StrS aminotransferase family protein [Pseudomonadota bacterium]
MQFIDLAAQQDRIRDRIEQRIAAVLSHGKYILGPEVAELEAALADFADVPHAIGCANGTDALRMALSALGAGPGAAVFCPSFTFVATAGVVPPFGATPVFVDIDPVTFNMSADNLARAIAHARDEGLTPRGVIVVDLFGVPADWDALEPVARDAGLWIIADCAQSFGARLAGRSTVSFGDIATTSFFPAKPLGCYGDGGALFCADPEHAALLTSLRFHGKGDHKYENVRIGTNSRLDTLQAAILLEKLAVFADEIDARQAIAARYAEGLRDVVTVPQHSNAASPTWAQYTVVPPEGTARQRIMAHLKDAGVPTAVYYPKPLHQQGAFCGIGLTDPVGLPVSDDMAERVFSLPMHPYLGAEDQDRVIGAVREAISIKQGA